MTTAGGESTRPPAGRAPVGRPGLRWAGDGALVPAPVVAARGAPATRASGPVRAAPSGAVIASFARRCGGFVIDFLLISVIYAVVLAIVFGDREPRDISRVDLTWLPFVTTGMIVRVGYNWFWNSRGWSPGKRVCGLRLEGADGRPPTLLHALARALFAEVSLFLWLGYAWALWDRQCQTWHDHVARTWVVRAEAAVPGDRAEPPGR